MRIITQGMSLPATPNDVRAAYRLLLGREPDPQGFAHWCVQAEASALDTQGLCAMITQSEEYRRQPPEERGVDIGGTTVFVNPWDYDMGASIVTHRTWEPHLRAVLARCLKPGDVFVDIGANIGVMSFDAARLVGPQGRVIAFEPEPRNMRLLLRGIAANGFAHISAFALALSDAPRIVSMTGNSNGTVIAADPLMGLVQAIPGDELLAGQPRIDMIKLDIEGHEPAALRGLRRTLQRHRPWVLCEFNPARLGGPGSEGCTGMLNRIFSITGRLTAIQHDGAETPIDSQEALMALWRLRDTEVTASGYLPAGHVHMDLLFRVA